MSWFNLEALCRRCQKKISCDSTLKSVPEKREEKKKEKETYSQVLHTKTYLKKS